MQLRPYQQAAVDAVYRYLRAHDDNPCVVLPTACHAHGHPILMFDGTLRAVEDVAVGDLIMGPDSTSRRVLSLNRGEDELFRIRPHRGESFVVNAGHILSLVSTNEGKKRSPCYRRGGEIDNISVRDYLAKSRSWRHLRKLYRVGVEFLQPRDLPIPPYVLGLLLGDGCLRSVVELTTADEEVAHAWETYARTIGCSVAADDRGGRCPTYTLQRGQGKYNLVRESLFALELAERDSESKFIPHDYLTASRPDRLSLLAGLIDSDGSRQHAGFEVSTKSKELAADIVYLARSLGFGAYCTQKYSYCQTGAGGWFFRIGIDGNLGEVPCRLQRKRPLERRQKKSVLRTGFTVEPLGRGPYFGFSLDGDHLYVDGHFIVHHNSGKTPVMATICRDAVLQWNGRVLILAHVKELLEQAADKLRLICPEVKFGVYSAGLRRRDTEHAVIIAGIQSVYRRACELDAFDLAIVDEAHLIPPDGEGMYRQFLAEARVVNPHLRTIGLTATPFRLKSGLICGPENILNAVCYEVGVRELIRDGYLCPLTTKAGRAKIDTSGLHVRGGEFVADEVEDLMDEDGVVHAACAEIVGLTHARRSCLVFASGVRHGRHVARILSEMRGAECGFVCGDTSVRERDALLDRFRRGELHYLCNVNVLTTGFDAPNIDCVVLLRPTMSPGLFYQMCLDMETEVLTRDGWRRCHEVAVGDTVATFDLESEEIVYVPAIDKVHRPLRAGESMYGISAPHLDLRVTDRHTMVVRGRAKSCLHWQLPTAHDASQRRDSYTIPVAGRGLGYCREADLSDAEVAFIGWFLTDGYLNRSNGAIVISQSAVKFATEIREVLLSCNLGFREYRHPRRGKRAKYADGLQFVIPRYQGRGANRGLRGWNDLAPWLDKDIPAIFGTLSRRQFAILLEAMNMANGRHRIHPGYIDRVMQISVGCRQRLADRIQQLAIERGFRCNVTRFVLRPSTWNSDPQAQWMIRIKPQRVAYVGGTARDVSRQRCRLTPVDFQRNEWVWCLTTEKGTLVTRRHGKVAIVGNCGRGFRLFPGKHDCLVLDFGGNVLRHGPVDQITVRERPGGGQGQAPAKECPECQAVVAAGYARCPQCGYEFPPPDRQKHDAKPTEEGILSGQVTTTVYEVRDVYYGVHTKRGAGENTPKTMRVDYKVGWHEYKSEWICFEHEGFARQKAVAWWRRRSPDPVPDSSERAVEIAAAGGLAIPKTITVRTIAGEPYDRIVDYELGPLPEPVPADDGSGYDPDEIPF